MPIFTQQPQPYDLSNISILIVEDSLYIQNLLSQMLKTFGVGEIFTCSNVKEAKDLLTALQASKKSKYLRSIDIILTDWLMPDATGADLLSWIRKHHSDYVRFLPVVVVSGYTTEYITSVARDLGAHESMVKPISANGIASRICNVIENPRAFIKSPNFFGPDRRRKTEAYTGNDRRILKSEEIEVKYVKTE